jgi:hypothetical protein
VAQSFLGVRLSALRQAQNPDGGWGYFPGKSSWLEPTAYAALALHGDPAGDRAWTLLRSWQSSDGSWRPSSGVNVANWGTSLCVTIAVARKEWHEPLQKGVDWLLASSGAESRMVNRIAASIGLLKSERNIALKAWPWKPDTSGWVEPTAHALVALKQASQKVSNSDLQERLRMGEAELMDVRSRDGGWNYGSPAALGVDLPSYPETTALALLGLQGRAGLGGAFDLAARQLQQTPSPLARAWLTIASRLHGAKPEEPTGELTGDLMITAVEALAAADGNYTLLRTGGAS